MKAYEKQKAINLRKKGQSIKEISRTLGVSKGSVSLWVRDVPISDEIKRNLFLRGWTNEAIENRRAARLKNEETKRSIIIDASKKDFTALNKRDLKIIGATLYWAEGGKTNRGITRFSNSDPVLIRIMMKFFREVCDVPETKFRFQIHTHSHLNINKCEYYWSNITKLPLKHFYKTYSKPSKASLGKRQSLPYGTLDISICDTKLFLTVLGWRQKIGELALKG